MARRGTSKRFSIEHEDHIANLFNGRRNKSSGAAPHESGDVTCDTYVIECKVTGRPGQVIDKKATLVKEFEKINEEAKMVGKTPVLAKRYFDPTSPLARPDGWVDLVVMTAEDAAWCSS